MDARKELFKIDSGSKLPLYDQIERNFRDLIVNGRLQPGQMVPSEWDLSELYGVSRLTVRKALEELVRQNWLERRHGVGTFVRQPAIASIAASKLSFTEQMKAIGRRPRSRLIKHGIVPATPKIARVLRLQEGEPLFEITRVRLADEIPILLETSCLPQEKFPSLSAREWSGEDSLYHVLSEEYQVVITGLDHTLKPVLLTETEAHYLHAKSGTPALLSEIIAFTREGMPVEYAWSFSNGDQSEFYFHFQRVEPDS